MNLGIRYLDGVEAQINEHLKEAIFAEAKAWGQLAEAQCKHDCKKSYALALYQYKRVMYLYEKLLIYNLESEATYKAFMIKALLKVCEILERQSKYREAASKYREIAKMHFELSCYDKSIETMTKAVEVYEQDTENAPEEDTDIYEEAESLRERIALHRGKDTILAEAEKHKEAFNLARKNNNRNEANKATQREADAYAQIATLSSEYAQQAENSYRALDMKEQEMDMCLQAALCLSKEKQYGFAALKFGRFNRYVRTKSQPHRLKDKTEAPLVEGDFFNNLDKAINEVKTRLKYEHRYPANNHLSNEAEALLNYAKSDDTYDSKALHAIYAGDLYRELNKITEARDAYQLASKYLQKRHRHLGNTDKQLMGGLFGRINESLNSLNKSAEAS